MGSLTSVNNLPNTRVFIAAEKWMVRSTGYLVDDFVKFTDNIGLPAL